MNSKNKPQLSVFIATSLDGYIARPDGSIDWLTNSNEPIPEGEDCGYAAFMNSIDTLIMGRNTYEKVLSFGDWPYGDKPVIVLSSRKLDIPQKLKKTVSHSNETPSALIKRLTETGVKKAYIDGGNTIGRFLSEDLISDLTITLIPVVLGSGISLFGPQNEDLSLTLLSSTSYKFGLVQLHYEIVNKR
jgi:dihydrofolate reductase